MSQKKVYVLLERLQDVAVKELGQMTDAELLSASIRDGYDVQAEVSALQERVAAELPRYERSLQAQGLLTFEPVVSDSADAADGADRADGADADSPATEDSAGRDALDGDIAGLDLARAAHAAAAKEGWSPDKVAAVELEYRCFLQCLRDFPDETITPGGDCHRFWCCHVDCGDLYLQQTTQILGHGFRYPEPRSRLGPAAVRSRGALQRAFTGHVALAAAAAVLAAGAALVGIGHQPYMLAVPPAVQMRAVPPPAAESAAAHQFWPSGGSGIPVTVDAGAGLAPQSEPAPAPAQPTQELHTLAAPSSAAPPVASLGQGIRAHPRGTGAPASAGGMPLAVPPGVEPPAPPPVDRSLDPGPLPADSPEAEYAAVVATIIKAGSGIPDSPGIDAALLKGREAVVSFELDRQGRVSQVFVDRPSGSQALDKLAQRIVSSGHYPPFPEGAWTGKKNRIFTVTIPFRPNGTP